MPPGTPLGEYLRARRALVRPEDVGVFPGARRRVAGLRREELAMLAGISPNYYLRLEQGRDRRPSPQMIDALARALQLDADATTFLHALARPEPETRAPSQRERAPTSIEWLIGSWRDTPAFVHDRHMDVLAANQISLALTPPLRPGVNAVRAIFMEPATRPRSRIYNHPAVRRLELFPEVLTIAGTDRQVLYIRHAEPGSPSERALNRLADIVAGAHTVTDPAGVGTAGLWLTPTDRRTIGATR